MAISSQARKGRFNDHRESEYGQAAGSAGHPPGVMIWSDLMGNHEQCLQANSSVCIIRVIGGTHEEAKMGNYEQETLARRFNEKWVENENSGCWITCIPRFLGIS